MDEKNEELIEIYPDASSTTDEDSVIVVSSEKSIETVSGEESVSINDEVGTNEKEKGSSSESEEIQDDYADDLAALEHEESDDEIIKNLSDSINMQVELDLVTMNVGEDNKKKEESSVLTFKERFLKFCKSKYVLIIPATLALIMFIVVGVYFIARGKEKVIDAASEYIADNVNYQEALPVEQLSEEEKNTLEVTEGDLGEGESEQPTATPEPTETPTPTPDELPNKPIINILLVGEENITGYTGRGRTDLIDIITLNSEKKTISVTSILRDCLVKIPGYSDNRINAVYAIGGVSLLNDTIESNFEFRPDNYILVNFASFENVINSLDGIDIALSEQEAKYLNKTNYISNPAYRNVHEGMNHLNGNQALGYCRIRKVGTKNNEYSDFGRSSRHREVLLAIFKKLSTLSLSELKERGDNCLSMITTDLDSASISKLINMYFEIGSVNVEQYRIPIDGSYKTALLRDMQVTEFNKVKNLAVISGIVK